MRPMGSGSPSLGSLLLRGRILRALLRASIQEARRRGLSHWSAIAMEANEGMRSAIERLGGERAFVTYRGFVAEAARRLEGPGSPGRPRTRGTPDLDAGMAEGRIDAAPATIEDSAIGNNGGIM